MDGLLDELGITEEMFEDLLKIYESVRDEYIDLTKKVKLNHTQFPSLGIFISKKVGN